MLSAYVGGVRVPAASSECQESEVEQGRLECVVYERATAGDSGEGDETAREAVAARDACLLLRWWYEVGNRRVRRCCQNKQTKLESQQRLPNRRAPTQSYNPTQP